MIPQAPRSKADQAALIAAQKRMAIWLGDIGAFARDEFQFEPDPWQRDFFAAWDKGDNRIALRACKGPGKTAVLAIAIWHFIATRPNPKIAATSISEANLSDCLWTELAKWQQLSPFLQKAFTWTKSRIFANDQPETWWASARTWAKSANPDQQADTLAGLHADYMLFVLDETGAMPAAVMAAATAALASGIETRILQAGNPTQCDGVLWEACNKEKHLWTIIGITGDPDDPKRSPRIDLQYARDQIQLHGRDNPWIMANILGKFPPSSPLSFISTLMVEEAMKREASANITDPLIYGVDVARFGNDQSVLGRRKGRDARTHPPVAWRNLDNMQLAARIAELAQLERPDAIFIDGGGNGGGVIDRLRQLKVPNVFEIQFGAKADRITFDGDAARYANKAAEMYGNLKAWLPYGALPDNEELKTDLTNRRYAYVNKDGHDCITLEPKDEMKKRGLASPDYGDAYALTFAYPVQPSATAGHAMAGVMQRDNLATMDYDPFASERVIQPGRAATEYDPYA